MELDDYGYVTDEWLEMMSKEWLVSYVKTLKEDIRKLKQQMESMQYEVK